MTARGRALLTTELALAVVTGMAIVGMHRLFADGSYRGALLLQAAAAHATVALLRRARIPLVLSAVATALAAVLFVCWVHYAGTTALLVPTGDTWAAAGDDLRGAWRLFKDVRAPAPVDPGFLVAASGAVWVAAYVADWAAFRAGATFEALLPSATLFLFAAALGAPGGRVAGATAYAAAAMGFVLLQRTLHQEESSAWAASQRSRGRSSLLVTGASLIAVAVVAGAVSGPNLPGADAEPLIAWRDMDGDDATRVVVSPLVDLQTRLVEQPDVELFQVRSSVDAYWRLTALDEFNGQIWRSSYGTNNADGELPQSYGGDTETTLVQQTISISALAAVWLPAAFEPRAIEPGGNQVDWDADSSTLIVDRQVADSDGFTYQVTSEVPEWNRDRLRQASGEVPDDVRDRYLQLPDDLNPAVRELAEQVTADAATPYDKALALQAHLRTFDYDLRAPRGHSSDALSSFLFETKRGYCEQFAGSFAALARSIGLPTRVAVGFSQGIRDARDPTLYHVRGEHAHAWTEVYLPSYGWVIFDPTPGRAPPRADRWLGVPAQQDEAGGDGTVATTAPPDQAPAPGPQGPVGPSGQAETAPPPREEVAVGQGAGEGDQDGDNGFGRTLRTLGLLVAAVAAAYAVLVPVLGAAYGALRRRRARAPTARIRLAWREVGEAATGAGMRLAPSLTISETAERLMRAVPATAGEVRRLAAATEAVVYAEAEPTPADVEAAVAAQGAVTRELARQTPVLRRTFQRLDARRLWRHRPHQRRRSAGALVATISANTASR